MTSDRYQKGMDKLKELTVASDSSPTGHMEIGMHVITGLNVGLTADEIAGCIMHLIPYVGFPRALNALKVAQEVFAEQGVEISSSTEL